MELKFRIWNVNGNVMHDWDEVVEKNKIHLLCVQRPAYPVMQYTGLKDKNGVEVYSGDIIKSFHFTDVGGVNHWLYFEVKWSEKFSGWVVVGDDGVEKQLWVFSKSLDGCFYVIGNIYENPELLEVVK